MLRARQSGSADESALGTPYDRARTVTLALIVGLTCLVVALPFVPGRIVEGLALHLALKQDLPLVPIFLVAALLRPNPRTISLPRAPQDTRLALLLTIVVILLAGWLGHYLVFQGYDLSRDEQMAVFDQEIFAHRRLLWPIPLEWRHLADALNRRFMLPIGNNEFWVSGYLPVHSGFRAILSTIGIAVLASPLMMALAAGSLWAIARKLWPDSNQTVLLSLLLLVTSSQALITSMTAFSMSMHLGLNLLWLALFVADRRQTHLLAILVAFFATGIHQPLFHPLFVLPFLLLLLEQRRWRLLAFYVGFYAVIGLFWLAWPIWIASHGVAPPTVINCANPNCSGGIGFLERLIGALNAFSLRHVWLTAANLLRFVCWQHPLLMPLALFGAVSCWRSEPLVKALALSFILPVIAMAILLPWQGHGYGYRYVHPALGSAILLACYGFRRAEASGLALQRPIIITTALAVTLLPLHAWMAWRVAAPFAQVRNELAAVPADVVIVDTERVPFGQDVVFNRFDLSNRPKLLIADLVRPDDLGDLCKRWRIAFFDAPRLAPIAILFGTRVPSTPSPRARELRGAANKLHCHVVE